MSFENRKDGRVVSMGASMEIFWLAAGLGRQLYARATKHFEEDERRRVVWEMVGLAVAIFVLLAINTAYAVYWSFLIRRLLQPFKRKKKKHFTLSCTR